MRIKEIFVIRSTSLNKTFLSEYEDSWCQGWQKNCNQHFHLTCHWMDKEKNQRTLQLNCHKKLRWCVVGEGLSWIAHVELPPSLDHRTFPEAVVSTGCSSCTLYPSTQRCTIHRELHVGLKVLCRLTLWRPAVWTAQQLTEDHGSLMLDSRGKVLQSWG